MPILRNGTGDEITIETAVDEDDRLQWWVDLAALFAGQSKGDRSVFLAFDPDRRDDKADPSAQVVMMTSAGSINAELMGRLARFGYCAHDVERSEAAKADLIATTEGDEQKIAAISEMDMRTWAIKRGKDIAHFTVASHFAHEYHDEPPRYHEYRYGRFHLMRFAGVPVSIIDMIRQVSASGVGSTFADDISELIDNPDPQFPMPVEALKAARHLYDEMLDAGYFEPADPPTNKEGQRRLALTPIGAHTLPFCIDHLLNRQP